MLIMLGCIVVLVAALAFGFYLHIQKLIASVPKPGPQTVTSMLIRPMEWKPQLSAVATMSPVKGVDLSSEVSGLVVQVMFRSGQTVKAGDAFALGVDDLSEGFDKSFHVAANHHGHAQCHQGVNEGCCQKANSDWHKNDTVVFMAVHHHQHTHDPGRQGNAKSEDQSGCARD